MGVDVLCLCQPPLPVVLSSPCEVPTDRNRNTLTQLLSIQVRISTASYRDPPRGWTKLGSGCRSLEMVDRGVTK